MVLGNDEGFSLAEARGIGALFLTRTDEGIRARTTSHFPQAVRVSAVAAGPDKNGGSLSTFLIAAIVFGLAIAGMAIGVLVSNRRLRGSCGGMSGLRDEHGHPLCTICTHPAEECDEFRQKMASASRASRDEGENASS
jgi:hypothetical protein